MSLLCLKVLSSFPWSNKFIPRLVGFFPGVRETVISLERRTGEGEMEDLTQSWSRLTLTDREGPGCSLTATNSLEEFSILAKFFTKRNLSIDAIARTFNPI